MNPVETKALVEWAIKHGLIKPPTPETRSVHAIKKSLGRYKYRKDLVGPFTNEHHRHAT